MATKKQNRCWPGYTPVPGKKQHEQGSCRPKADSKSTPSEKKVKANRRKQIDRWEEKSGGRRQAAQHLHEPGSEPRSAKKKATAKRTTAKKAGAKKATAKKAAAKKTAARRKAA